MECITARDDERMFCIYGISYERTWLINRFDYLFSQKQTIRNSFSWKKNVYEFFTLKHTENQLKILCFNHIECAHFVLRWSICAVDETEIDLKQNFATKYCQTWFLEMVRPGRGLIRCI